MNSLINEQFHSAFWDIFFSKFSSMLPNFHVTKIFLSLFIVICSLIKRAKVTLRKANILHRLAIICGWFSKCEIIYILSHPTSSEILHTYRPMDPFKKMCYKVHIFCEGHKILRNFHLTFDRHCIGQKYGEDFVKFCGLLRIYEL